LATVVFKKKAKKRLESIQPQGIREKIENKIRDAALNPTDNDKMEGSDSKYKFRQGDYRVCYEFDEDTNTITIREIGPRGDVYKKEARSK
jgi:mRNA-degrading endonuclease RelE of RelBE toxin-antitoxin system